MGKDTKKKKSKDGKKKGKSKTLVPAAAASGTSKVTAAAKKLKPLADNPLIADVIAAALVATAAAIKDSKTARRLAEQAGDEIDELGKAGADRGSALWQMALEVGRRALDEISGEQPKTKARAAKPAAGDED